jgi:APA family basic amino acid/polyamine antiporter
MLGRTHQRGVAVAVGAGIFSVGATAAANYAGPSVIVSFVIAAVVCGLAIMCYAEFASTIPVAGSAYTYSCSTMGEVVAWIIGWDLILEMLLAAAVIAKFWGVYLSDAFTLFGSTLPTTLTVGGVDVAWGPVVIVA